MLYERKHNFQANETIVADEVDEELDELVNILNGNIEADNLKDGAVTTAKLETSLNPTTRTAETVGDMVASGLEMQNIKTITGAWANRDETFSSGYAYIDGVRVYSAGGSKTFDANTTTYVLLKDTGDLAYESSASVGYNNLPLYKVTTDATKITIAQPLAWGLIGTVIPYVGKDAPYGYLLCNGAEASRTTYSKLFNICQNNFGTPGSAAVFKLPDLRTRTVHGYGDPTYYTVFGGTGGGYTASHNHAGDSHTHTYSGNTTSSSSDAGSGIVASTSPGAPDHDHDYSGTTSAGAGTTGTSAPSILDPYITLNYIVKAF